MDSDTVLLNRYQLQQKLSVKAGRQTFLAQDLQIQQPVIVKILQFNQYFQWDDLKLFEREAQILQTLNHPAIPKYQDYFELEIEGTQSFVLIQTYIEAPSLASVIQNGRSFSEAETIEIAKNLLTILSYLHEQLPPIIHRDIKPSNILIANRSGNTLGDIYLVDFGSVQTVANKDNGTITIVGSYGYIPLEQFAGHTTAASDLYSLGMTLTYLMTGIHPSELPQKDGRISMLDIGLSPNYFRWLERLTHPYSDQRFDSAKIALSALTSENNSYGYYHHMRPANSRINICRDHTRIRLSIEKIVTAKAVASISALVICLALMVRSIIAGGWTAGLGAIPALAIFFVVTSSFGQLLGWLVIKALSINKFLRKNLFTYFETIIIDRESGICSTRARHELTNVKENYTSPYQDIHFLVYNPGYKFNTFLEGGKEVSTTKTVNILPTLSIYAGSGEYPIWHNQLSHPELWWIGQELSDFLGLDLQVVYPTPEVPQEFTCGGGC